MTSSSSSPSETPLTTSGLYTVLLTALFVFSKLTQFDSLFHPGLCSDIHLSNFLQQSTLPPHSFIFLSWTYCYFTEYTFVFNMSSTSGKPAFVKVNGLLSMTQILTSAPWVSTSVCTFSSCVSNHFSYFDSH